MGEVCVCVCERWCLEMCQSQVNRRDRMWAPKLKTSEADRVGSKRQECSSRVVPDQRCQGHLTSLNLKLVSLNQKLWE